MVNNANIILAKIKVAVHNLYLFCLKFTKYFHHFLSCCFVKRPVIVFGAYSFKRVITSVG